MNHSFTDEQLLNLVNNTIHTKTEYNVEDFTGGSVQIVSTNNHQLVKYKVTMFFGYTETRNSVSKTIDINEGLVSIWMSALFLKTKSLQLSNNGMDYSELNSLMNFSNQVEVVSNEVVSNKYKSPSYDVRTNGSTNYYEHENDFTLSKDTHYSKLSSEYKEALEVYVSKLNMSLPFQEFVDGLETKSSYKYKNFVKAYRSWANRRPSSNKINTHTGLSKKNYSVESF